MQNKIEDLEDKYRGVNAQLEAETAKLFGEADEIIKNANKFDIRDSIEQQSIDIVPSYGDSLSVMGDEQEELPRDIAMETLAATNPVIQNRYILAKLKAVTEQQEKSNAEIVKLRDEVKTLSARNKELEDDRNRLCRTSKSQFTELEKLKSQTNDLRAVNGTLETEKTSFKKENDALLRQIDQLKSQVKTLTNQTNRVGEELTKLKHDCAESTSHSKEQINLLSLQLDDAKSEKKRLDKQKQELITGFKKQMKLIDILRRQKTLIEASALLQITEEEFLKALEWQAS